MNEDVDVVAFGTYTPNKPGINGRAAFTILYKKLRELA